MFSVFFKGKQAVERGGSYNGEELQQSSLKLSSSLACVSDTGKKRERGQKTQNDKVFVARNYFL